VNQIIVFKIESFLSKNTKFIRKSIQVS